MKIEIEMNAMLKVRDGTNGGMVAKTPDSSKSPHSGQKVGRIVTTPEFFISLFPSRDPQRRSGDNHSHSFNMQY
jgi:hypothetical protein